MSLSRHHRSLLACGALSVLAGLCACSPGESENDEGRPNVVLIVVDTLRADHLGTYEYERATSPAIDTLAREGRVFRQATSQAPWTTPSIGSLLTSRLPSELGLHTIRNALPDGAHTLAELLGERGWNTAAVVSHKLCGSDWSFDQGFDVFDDSNALGHQAVTSPAVSTRANELLGQLAEEDAPFFLWVHLFDVHAAYIEHDAHRFPGVPGYEGPVEDGTPYATLNQMRSELVPDDAAEMQRYYDSEIAWTDLHVGHVLDRLRELGVYNETLVVLTADHGEEFLDHDGIGHSRTLYQELVHVPLIVKLPAGSQAGATLAAKDTPVALLDVAPTVLEVAGITGDFELRGRSLCAAVGEEPIIPIETAKAGGWRGARLGRYKHIQPLRGGAAELYDLDQDPQERHNLLAVAGDIPREAALAESRLGLWLAGWDERYGLAVEPAEPVEIDAPLENELSDLGYTGDD
jgi:arylsulfatase A-like enzyme